VTSVLYDFSIGQFVKNSSVVHFLYASHPSPATLRSTIGAYEVNGCGRLYVSHTRGVHV
jgi:hypothetical protein